MFKENKEMKTLLEKIEEICKECKEKNPKPIRIEGKKTNIVIEKVKK